MACIALVESNHCSQLSLMYDMKILCPLQEEEKVFSRHRCGYKCLPTKESGTFKNEYEATHLDENSYFSLPSLNHG